MMASYYCSVQMGDQTLETRSATDILRRFASAACVALGMAGQVSPADARWISLDLGSTDTTPAAINDKGVVVGTYVGDDGEFGFLRDRNGIVIGFQAVEGAGTIATAINTDGAVTGYYGNRAAGFVRNPEGILTTFKVADGVSTYPLGINGKGAIAGYCYEPGVGLRGFLRTPGGKMKAFHVRKAANTYASAINDNGTIAGSYGDVNGAWHGFVRAPDGSLTKFNIPKVTATGLMSSGINASGQIVGWYADSNNYIYGFLRNPDGSIITLDYSNGYFIPDTVASGINDVGQIVGGFVDSAGDHGFVRSPDGQVTALDFPGNYDGTTAVGINKKGQVTGYYLLGESCTAYTFCGFVLKP